MKWSPAWFHMDTLVFKFRGVDTISDAERLSGAEVRVPAERARSPGRERVLSVGPDRLRGVRCGQRRARRIVSPVGKTPAAMGSWWWTAVCLIPFARSICKQIDPAARRIAVELPEGLKDLNRT